ncbi:uncharacterized protein LOC124598993 [Schistocerca americana]|uniref:uncharacterized protein LOC124598993 n=1 Tax=Schistocerca americana TaxID=7009 RepID=UPI001F4FEF93|nr:uncharacterized protein LOC124598993 [Schistocerca americana]XP_046991997.1 uncharacterized protein LOC124598993 [Schistocerca americana]XP_046991998.1 uncharacterized protein LOC124598993 [Schistocerca americana]
MVGPGLEYRVVRGSAADCSRVESFLRRVFYPCEPLCAALGFTAGPADAADMPTLDDLRAGWSLLAERRHDGALVAACICALLQPAEDGGAAGHHRQFGDERMAEIWRVVGVAHAAAGLEGRRALDVSLLAVDPSLRGAGLGLELLRRAADVGREAGAPLLTVVCTSAYSARLAHKLGMRCLHSLPYHQAGLAHLPQEPHTHVHVYALDL